MPTETELKFAAVSEMIANSMPEGWGFVLVGINVTSPQSPTPELMMCSDAPGETPEKRGELIAMTLKYAWKRQRKAVDGKNASFTQWLFPRRGE